MERLTLKDRQSGKQTFRVRTGQYGRKLERHRLLCISRYTPTPKRKGQKGRH